MRRLKSRAVEAVELPVAQEVLGDGQLLVDGGGLEDHADRASHVRGARAHVEPEHANGAVGGRQQRAEDAEQRGLAATVGAEQREDLAGRRP